MTVTDFRARLVALGYEDPADAARALGISRSACYRMWHGERRVSQRTERALLLLEAAQPGRLTAAMLRALLQCGDARAGDTVLAEPDVMAELYGSKLVRRDGRRMVLTDAGARAAAFLRALHALEEL